MRHQVHNRVLKQVSLQNQVRMTGNMRLQNLSYILQGVDFDMSMDYLISLVDLNQVQEDEDT